MLRRTKGRHLHRLFMSSWRPIIVSTTTFFWDRFVRRLAARSHRKVPHVWVPDQVLRERKSKNRCTWVLSPATAGCQRFFAIANALAHQLPLCSRGATRSPFVRPLTVLDRLDLREKCFDSLRSWRSRSRHNCSDLISSLPGTVQYLVFLAYF